MYTIGAWKSSLNVSALYPVVAYPNTNSAIVVALETLTLEGLPILCADGYTRQCYPIIAGFKVDYKEQILITGVKGDHCTICQVPPDRREDIQVKWPSRTHESTQKQLRLQAETQMNPKHPDWVHPVENFAWKHHHLNIHDAMMVDILHQLHSNGIVDHLLKWVRKLLDKHVPRSRRTANGDILPGQTAKDQLERRFQMVTAFVGLKHFSHFSEVKQWTGNEQKSILHQMVPVIAPLLTPIDPHAMLCVRAFMDFVMLAHYRSHDEETLGYMEHALKRIDLLKEVFRTCREGKKRKNGKSKKKKRPL